MTSPNGNTTTIGGIAREFTYNHANRLSAASRHGLTTATYTYSGRGEQVQRRSAGHTTVYLHDEAGHLLGEYDDNGEPLQQIVWLDDLPVGLLIGPPAANAPLHYIEADALGTPRIVIDPQRDVVVWEWPLTGEAFGKDLPDEDPDGDGNALTFNLRFPGQRFDAATGLNQNRFRDYDPWIGAYPQSDPIGLRGGVSTYAYVSSNPVSRIDPWGLKDYTECETREELNKVFLQLNKFPELPYNGWRVATVAWNHSGGGIFDYKIRQPADTFSINGQQYSAAAFGNFAAGYMAAWFGPGGYEATRAAGIVFDYIDGASNWDLDSVPDIDAGYEMGKGEQKSGKLNSCGCGGSR